MGWAANRPSEEKTVADVGRTWYTRYNIYITSHPSRTHTHPVLTVREPPPPQPSRSLKLPPLTLPYELRTEN